MSFDPGIKFDGHRAFWGKPQLTDAENRLLNLIEQVGLRLSFKDGVPSFFAGDRRLEKNVRQRAQRLIERGYLIPNSRGLFPDGPDQTWTRRPRKKTDPL